MELYDFLKHLNSGAPVYSDSEAFEYMHELSNEAMRITFRTAPTILRKRYGPCFHN